jgi:chemotaxis family two-component system sensor kinase Cph1
MFCLKESVNVYAKDVALSLRQLILEKSPTCIAVLDINFKFLLTSSRFADLFGCIPNELISRHIQDVLPVFFQSIEECLVSVLKGQLVKNEAYIALDNLASSVCLYWEIHQWKTKKGDVLGLILYLEDRTFCRNSEKKMQKTIQDLQKMNYELERFAYICSHDINEPLRSISSFLQLIQKNKMDTFDLETKKYMGFVMTSLHRLQNLVRDILSFSKVTLNVKHTNISSASALQDAIESLAAKIKEVQANITYDLLPDVYGDKTQVMQLFINLLDNAIKFKGNRPPVIHVGVSDAESFWCFYVKDNGIGVEKEYQKRIFEMFERLHGKHDYEGSGIGLAVCKKIVEFYGGNICLESEIGVGSTFYFTLPKSKCYSGYFERV